MKLAAMIRDEAGITLRDKDGIWIPDATNPR
jgi:hypothetical protein